MAIDKLKVVDGLDLSETHRKALKPGEEVTGDDGRTYTLPRYFYEIDSWKTAKETTLAPEFGLYEFVNTDVREARVLRSFPRYVPLALLHLAAHLAVLRKHVGTYVHVAANGGYRSPAHRLTAAVSPHCWGTAANIYRIGDDFMTSEETTRTYQEIITEILPGAWIRPYGTDVGGTIDHLHIDLGRYTITPRDQTVD